MATVRSILIAIATGALWVAGCAAPAVSNDPRAVVPVAVARPDVQLSVVSAQFGVFGADSLGRRVLFETDKFPAIVAAPFGWLVLFKTDKPTVIWREEFELPEVPPTWGPGEAMGIFQVSPDRKTAVTERIIPSRLGFVGNEWRYAPGDPIGAHKMRVYIDGQLIKEFKFDIEVGSEQPDRLPGSRSRGGSRT
jgi:hypothetical protein